MVLFLSDEWLEEMSKAVSDVKADSDLSVVEIVDLPDGSSRNYRINLSPDGCSVEPIKNADEPRSLALRQSLETATALHKGELNVKDAMFKGKIKVAGKLGLLLSSSRVLTEIMEKTQEVRAKTIYEDL